MDWCLGRLEYVDWCWGWLHGVQVTVLMDGRRVQRSCGEWWAKYRILDFSRWD